MRSTPESYAEWVADHFLSDLRSGTRFSQSVVENIASFPYIGLIRGKLTSADHVHILGLLNSSDWWEARLGISIARRISNDDITTRITEQFRNNPELRVRLSAAFALAELVPDLMPELETFLNKVILEQPKRLMAVTEQFYGSGRPPDKLLERASQNSSGRILYHRLLSLFPDSGRIAE